MKRRVSTIPPKTTISTAENKKDPIFNTAIIEIYKTQKESLEKEIVDLQTNLAKQSNKCKRYKEKLDQISVNTNQAKPRKNKEKCDKNIECNFLKDNNIEKNANQLVNLILKPAENIVTKK